MKHPSRIAKHRRNSFDNDFNPQEDDLLLADVKILPDESELNITPLNHLIDDQDDIDRLLVNTGFDTELIYTDRRPDAFVVIDGINPGDDTAKFDTPNFDIEEPRFTESVADAALQPETAPDFQVDSFISTYLAMRPALQSAEPGTALNDTPTELITEPVVNAPAEPGDNENNAEIMQKTASEHFFSDHTKTRPLEFTPEQKNADNPPQRSQTKNTLAYLMIAVAGATLLSTLALGIMVYNMKTELEKLTGLLAVIKDDMEISRPNQNFESEDNRTGKPSQQ